MNKVSLHYCENYDFEEIDACLNKCFEDMGGLEKYIKPKMKVMLKCNLSVPSEPNEAKTTNPAIIIALSEKIAKLGATCFIVDSPDDCHISLSSLYEKTQMLYASNMASADLNSNENVFITNIDGKMCKSLYLIDAINDADIIINIPKLIASKNGGVSCGLENLFGLIPSEMKTIVKNRFFTPQNYYDYLIDIYNTVKDKLVLNIVDGIVAREANELQRILNCIIVGENVFDVDYVAFSILSANNKENEMFDCAKERDCFAYNNTQIVGDKISDFTKEDFTYYENNPKEKSSNAKKHKYNQYTQRPNILTNKCKGCEQCIKNCPAKAISAERDENDEIYASLDYTKCIHCFTCVKTCPYGVIETTTPCNHKVLFNRMSKRSIKKDENTNN